MSTPTVIIIGAGPSGICAGIKLQEQVGIKSFTIFERSDNLGGTWWANKYRGCGCDVASHLYSYSFEPNSGWTKLYSQQSEIWAYFDRVARKHNLVDKIKFRSEVTIAQWSSERNMWKVTVRNLATGFEEDHWANYVINAFGGLCIPRTPKIAGLEAFKGKVQHTAQWDDTIDLTNKTIVVIGTAASGVQVIPELQKVAKKLTVFQRSPNWIVPRHQFSYSPTIKWVFEHVPGVMFAHRSLMYLYGEIEFFVFQQGTFMNWVGKQLALSHLKNSVKDPKLRKILTPTYPIGCKRVLVSDDFYPALTKSNVQVVTDSIHHITSEGVATNNGTVYPADVIVFATGFDVGTLPITIIGRDGFNLNQSFKTEGPKAFLGITAPKTPNMFTLIGPNTGLGHNSALVLIETQTNYMMQLLKEMWKQGAPTVEPKMEVFNRYNISIQKALQKTVWAGSCTSWYKSADGNIFAAWPHNTISYIWATTQPRWSDFEFTSSNKTRKLPPNFYESILAQLLAMVLMFAGFLVIYAF